MEFSEVLRRRQSCRQYQDRPVERETLAACLRAARLSPSGCNSQRWLFIAVDDPAIRAPLAAALEAPQLGINQFTGQIPAFIVVAAHPTRPLGPRAQTILETVDCLQMDIGIAAHQICLAATDLGLGSVILGWFDQPAVQSLLHLPPELEVQLVIGLGYPKSDTVREKSRLPAQEVIRWNSFNNIGEPL